MPRAAEWLPILDDNDPATDPTADITVAWTADEAHPQTCVTCHDPHSPGSTSGVGTNVTLRITENTPPLIAGFQARGVGRGATCMTCHNSRHGLHNDTVYPTFVGTSLTSQAPHGSAQADLLMGQNAYFVNVIELGSGGPIIADVATVSDIAFGEFHGSQAITVTFTDTG